MKYNKKFLIIGHGNCGTGFMSKILQSIGFDIGHEYMGKDGMSCWCWSVTDKDNDYPFGIKYKDRYKFANIIIAIRNPLDAIQTINYRANKSRLSRKFREKHLKIKFFPDDYNSSAISYLKWYELIFKNHPDAIKIHVEQAEKELAKKLDLSFKYRIPHDINSNKNKSGYKKISHRQLIKKIKPEIVKEVILFAMKEGYIK